MKHDIVYLSSRQTGRTADDGLSTPSRGGRPYRVVLRTPELVILRRDTRGELSYGRRARVLMAGEILESGTVLEIVNLISSSRWIGTLHLYSSDSHRVLGFYRGALLHARSDHPEDRLDKVLFRLGALDPSMAEEAMRGIRPNQRFGEALVERGLLERKDLFDHLQKQMEETLMSSVLEEQGCYVFEVADQPGPAPAASGHIPLQNLLLSAAEYLDVYREHLRQAGSLDMCPEVEPGAQIARRSANERLFLGYCDGRRTLRQIASESWLGRYRTMELASQLLRGEQIQLRLPRRSLVEISSRLIAPFNDVLGMIYRAADRWSDLPRLHREVHAWTAEPQRINTFGGLLDQSGLICSGPVEAMLEEGMSNLRLDLLRHEFHELASFALFTAALELPRERERELSRLVHEHLRDVMDP